MRSPIQRPTVEALYFAQKTADGMNDDEASSSSCFFSQLSAELLHASLVEYASWGDLAKLACVQSSWSSLLLDAARQSQTSQWELAQALLRGTDGFQVNTRLAMRLLQDLAGVQLQRVEGDDVACYAASVVADKTPFAPAMKCLAKCFLQGDDASSQGIPQDTDLGLSWLQAAYTLGNDADAAHELGKTYQKHSDEVAAAAWFQKAATAGHVEGMAKYALCCELGSGCDQNDDEAVQWYEKAANRGHVMAMHALAEAYEEGRGVPQSDEEAFLWYDKAAGASWR